ncbi:ABC transporter ATP-binding protein [Acidobacteriota bacterium]
MKKYFLNKAFNIILNSRYVKKLDAISIIFLICLMTVAEFGGIGMLVPILQYIDNGTSIESGDASSFIWEILTSVTNFLGLPLNLLTLLTLTFFLICIRQTFIYLKIKMTGKIQHETEAKIRTEIVDKFFQADLSFFLEQGQGNIISALTVHANRTGSLISFTFNLLSSIALILIYSILLFLLHPLLAIVALGVFSGVILLSYPFIRSSKRHSNVMIKENIKMFRQGVDRVYGAKLVKMFSQEKKEALRLERIIKQISQVKIKLNLDSAKITTINEPLIVLAILLIFYFAVQLLGMTITSLGLFIFFLYRMAPNIKGISINWQKIIALSKSYEFIEEIVQGAESSLSVQSGSVPFEGLKHDIVFDNVSFSYDKNCENNMVLKDLFFRIPFGSFFAIVGPSGAGKSTLADLIPRLREVTKGDILIDGIPIKYFELRSLRSRIGFLTQEPFLFNDTVFNNITYGFEGRISQKDVEAAAERAYAHEFIEKMPLKYENVLGDRGIRLSGGERQRLALARLIFHEPDIIILDEYASALDSKSEEYIQATIKKIKKNKTMIVIAHRLSTIKMAEQIIVLENGRITDCGDFKTLTYKDSSFKKLFEAQLFF